MLVQEEKTQEQPIPMDGQLLTSDEYQEEMASRISEEVFQTEENAEKTAGVISSFVQSYEQHKNEMTLDAWLIAEFKKYPGIWKDEAEIRTTASEVITAITAANQVQISLQAHLDQGKSEASWLAKEIEKGAAASAAANVGAYADGIDQALTEANKVSGVVNVAAYADVIDQSLTQANQNNWDVITRKDGFISQSPNLDGFIAEHHHANTFNIDAAAKGSSNRAVVLGSNGKDSVDIVIVDGEGNVIDNFQSKYYEDANASENALKHPDSGEDRYPDQKKLVPEGQGKDIKGSTEVIEIDGVSSKPLSKEAAKELQKKAQQEQEAKQHEWNEVSRMTIAKQIGKQALMGACITAGMQGSRILARRAWNSLTGKINPSASEDLQEFFESSIKSSAHVGIQVAVSGGLVVAVKNGWLGSALKSTPAGRIANIAYIAMENAKILYKLSKGELTKEEALDAMGQATTTTVFAIAGAVQGATFGASIGLVLGPVGAAVGGFVGGVVGGMAGSTIGQAVYEGGRAIVKTAVNTFKSVVSSIGSYAASAYSSFKSIFA